MIKKTQTLLKPDLRSNTAALLKIQNLIDSKDYDQAIQLCHEELGVRTHFHLEVYMLMGNSYFFKTDYITAITLYTNCLCTRTEIPILNNMGLCYLNLDNYNVGIKMLLRAHELDDKNKIISENLQSNIINQHSKSQPFKHDKDNLTMREELVRNVSKNSFLSNERFKFLEQSTIDSNFKERMESLSLKRVDFKNPFKTIQKSDITLDNDYSTDRSYEYQIQISNPPLVRVMSANKMDNWAQAIAYYEQECFYDAIKIFKKCLEPTQLKNKAVYSALMYSYDNLSDLANTAKYFRLYSKNAELNTNDLELKGCLEVFYSQNFTEAKSTFQLLPNESIKVLNAKAYMEMIEGFSSISIMTLNEILRISTYDPDIIYNKAIVYKNLGLYDKVINQIEILKNEDNWFSLLYLDSCRITDNKKQLLSFSEELIKRYKENVDPEIAERHGDILVKTSYKMLAISAYMAALNRFSGRDKIRLNTKIGKCFISLGNFKKSQEYLNAAITDGPTNPRSQFYLGKLYLQIKDYKKAHDYLMYVYKIVPDDYKVCYYLSLTYQKLNDNKKAIYYLNKGISNNPYRTKLHNYLGLLELNEGKTKAAIDSFNFADLIFNIETRKGEPSRRKNLGKYKTKVRGLNRYELYMNIAVGHFIEKNDKLCKEFLNRGLIMIETDYATDNEEEAKRLSDDLIKIISNLLLISILSNDAVVVNICVDKLKQLNLKPEIKKIVMNIQNSFAETIEILSAYAFLYLEHINVKLLTSYDIDIETLLKTIEKGLNMINAVFKKRQPLILHQEKFIKSLQSLKHKDNLMFDYYNYLLKLLSMYFCYIHKKHVSSASDDSKGIFYYVYRYDNDSFDISSIYDSKNYGSFKEILEFVESDYCGDKQVADKARVQKKINDLLKLKQKDFDLDFVMSKTFIEVYNVIMDNYVAKREDILTVNSTKVAKQFFDKNFDFAQFKNFQVVAMKDFAYIIRYLMKNSNSLLMLNIKFERVIKDILFSNEKFINDISYIVAKLEEQESNSTTANAIYFELNCDIKGRFDPKSTMFMLIKIYDEKYWKLLRKTKDTAYRDSVSIGRFGVKTTMPLTPENIKREDFDKQIKLEMYRKSGKTKKVFEFTFSLKEIILEKQLKFSHIESRCLSSTRYDFDLAYL